MQNRLHDKENLNLNIDPSIQSSKELFQEFHPQAQNQLQDLFSQHQMTDRHNQDLSHQQSVKSQQNLFYQQNDISRKTLQNTQSAKKMNESRSIFDQHPLQINSQFVSIQQNMTNIVLNDNLATTPSLNLQQMPSYSNLNPNAKCFIPKSCRNETEDVAKPIFKVINTNGKSSRKRQAPEDDEMIEGPKKKQQKGDNDLQVGQSFITYRDNNQVAENENLDQIQMPLKLMNRNASHNLCLSTQGAASLIMNPNSFVLNKSRTCIIEKDQMGQNSLLNNFIAGGVKKPVCDINKEQDKVEINPEEEERKVKERQEKFDKIQQFRAKREHVQEIKQEYCQQLRDIQECLQTKEVLENITKFKMDYSEEEIMGAARDPLLGHEVTKEYRTKMVDWMIEVCVSFKFSPRTYFLAVTILDKYLIACHQNGQALQNKDIHPLGVTAMYMASKYEDVFPLHSKIVAEKIAHHAISAEQIVANEKQFLQMFNFELDFVTHWDFYQTYCEKIEKMFYFEAQSQENQSHQFRSMAPDLLKVLNEMGLFLVKMGIQCADFCPYSPSTLVISSLYAATAFLKHSRMYQSDNTTRFCSAIRKIIFEILTLEKQEHQRVFTHQSISESQIQKYQNQFHQEFVEQVAMDLVDFFKIFDDWHCGLNQLKKFNKVPLE